MPEVSIDWIGLEHIEHASHTERTRHEYFNPHGLALVTRKNM